MNRPSPKKAEKISPITASSFRRLRRRMNSIAPAASPPARKAPSEKGRPIMYAPATPGTMAWESASPISDQPFSIR